MSIDERLRADGARWRATTPVVEWADRTLVGSAPSAGTDAVSSLYRPRRRIALVLSVVAIIAAAGILIGVLATRSGSRNRTGPAADGLPTSPVSTDPLDTSPAPGTDLSLARPVRVLTGKPSGRVLSMPWRLVSISNGGRTLIVYYVSGDGVRPDGVNAIGFQIIQTRRSVELIAVSRDANTGRDEAGSLAIGYGVITLTQPLNGRSLLHAPTNSGWPASLLN
jgi:hypothetical protein